MHGLLLSVFGAVTSNSLWAIKLEDYNSKVDPHSHLLGQSPHSVFGANVIFHSICDGVK